MTTLTIQEYLTQKGIEYRESGQELITQCLFNDCDKDSRRNEAHLYFNKNTNQYHCQKCGSSGNIFTLAKHFGDELVDIFSPSPYKKGEVQKDLFKEVAVPIDELLVNSYHEHLPPNIRGYLKARGITDEIISKNKLGYGHFYNKFWITIPIKNEKGEYTYLRLRKDPNDEQNSIKYAFYPRGASTTLYGWESLKTSKNFLFICEG